MKVKVVAVSMGYYGGSIKQEGESFMFSYPLGASRKGKEGGPLKLPRWLALADSKDLDKIAQAEKDAKAPKAAVPADR